MKKVEVHLHGRNGRPSWVSVPGPYGSLSEIRDANRRAGRLYFSEGAIAFFGSRPVDEVFGGRFFIDRCEPPGGGYVWALAACLNDGRVEQVDTGAGDSHLGTEWYTSEDGAVAAMEDLTRGI